MDPGIYLVHKQVGETSFSHVQRMLEEVRAAGIRRDRLPVCHGGALDPFAEGLLLLLAGPATRLMHFLHPIPKTYVAEIAWGAETDNGDPLGRVTARGDASPLEPETLQGALAPFLGWRDQVPPATSNKRIRGERAYVRAHRGESFQVPASRVYLHEASWVAHDLPRASTLRLITGGGYYVRALVRDLGRATAARAHLRALRRTAIGPWEDPPSAERRLIRGEALFPWCPAIRLDETELAALKAQRPIPARAVEPAAWLLPPGFPGIGAPVRALHGGALVAIVRERDGSLVPDPALRAPL